MAVLATSFGLNAQSTEYQKQAESYYNNEDRASEISKQFTKFWNKMFNQDYANFSEPVLVEWEYNNGWYHGRNGRGYRDGIGVYYFSENKARYFGGWKRDNFHGFGVYMKEKSIYIGMYDDDKQNGLAIKMWPSYSPLDANGFAGIVKYFGEYKDNKWHGYGIVYLKDGTYKSGIWIESTLSKELPKIDVVEKLGF